MATPLICGPLFIIAEDYKTFDIAEHKNIENERIFIIASHVGIREIMTFNTPMDLEIGLETPVKEPGQCPIS